jgi:hypothetical protein
MNCLVGDSREEGTAERKVEQRERENRKERTVSEADGHLTSCMVISALVYMGNQKRKKQLLYS